VSSHDDWLSPAWYESRDVRDNDWLSEHSSIQDVPDGSVRGFPHLLEVEFGHSLLVRGDGGALDSDLAGLDGFCSVDGDLVRGCVSVLDGQIKVLEVLDVDVWVDVLWAVS
jgi:hypothetical protein